MTTSSSSLPATPVAARVPLRLCLSEDPQPGTADGAWWPQSRNLLIEGADLVDHFPPSSGRINRLLYSRPDWDDWSVGGSSVRSVEAARGRVETGSFPSDDTRLMILTLDTGRRLKLLVISSGTPDEEGERALSSARSEGVLLEGRASPARWDDEIPHY